jgi:peptide/nickel transport system substrate-binding protein
MYKRLFVFCMLLVLVATSLAPALAQDGDTLTLLYWQAASTMNAYLSGGTKDIEAGSLVVEPLAHYDEGGTMVPTLVDEIPTVANGGVSEDLLTITWKLSEGIVWSDGTPLTSADAVFSWEYCVEPEMGCNALSSFEDVESVEALDELTILVTFSVPKPYPYGPFVGSTTPVLQKAQFENCMGIAAQECSEQNFHPIGTGPFVVEEFRANDVITLVANENYREEGKPYFSRAIFKGGGDATSAARAVLETGEADYAWNIQIAPEVKEQMLAAGYGTVVVSFGPGVERLMINQTNPDPALGDMRSAWVEDGSNAHPFLTDPAVWQALSMAIDRQILVDVGYGDTGAPACNVLPAPAYQLSPNNDGCLEQDIDGANALLDEAGIVDTDGDGIREKDGVPLVILYQTSTNAVRQDTQVLVKQWWAEIGVETELRNIDASVFFGGDPASPDTYGKFYSDVEMYTNTFDGTDPERYMTNWSCKEVSGPDNQWLGNNISRWCSAEYDALVAAMAQTADFDERAAIAIQMNDLVVQNGVVIPLIWRGDVSAHSNSIEGVRMNTWDSELWNVADWVRVD